MEDVCVWIITRTSMRWFFYGLYWKSFLLYLIILLYFHNIIFRIKNIFLYVAFHAPTYNIYFSIRNWWYSIVLVLMVHVFAETLYMFLRLTIRGNLTRGKTVFPVLDIKSFTDYGKWVLLFYLRIARKKTTTTSLRVYSKRKGEDASADKTFWKLDNCT